MLKKHIFKANRGEGKTKWLVERALNAQDNNLTPIYIGSADRYDLFCRVYEGFTHHKCMIEYHHKDIPLYHHSAHCLLTDELMGEIHNIPFIGPACEGDWYITMSAEDFEN